MYDSLIFSSKNLKMHILRASLVVQLVKIPAATRWVLAAPTPTRLPDKTWETLHIYVARKQLNQPSLEDCDPVILQLSFGQEAEEGNMNFEKKKKDLFLGPAL